MKSIEKRTLESVIAGGVLFAVTFIQSIVLVPLFLQYWGGERYGVWLTLYGFVMLMRSLDAGHQTYVGNEFNKMFHIDKAKAQQILGSSVKVAFLLGGAELLIYLLIIFFGQHKRFVGFDLENYPVSTGIIAFLLMWLLVGSVGGILVRVILPMGAYAKSVYLNIGIKVAETVCIAVCVIFNTSINTLSICIALCWLFYTLYLFAFVKKLMPDFYPWWIGGNWSLGIKNLTKSTAFTFNNFVEQFNSNGVLIAVSSIVGVEKVPAFSTIRTLTNVFSQATSIVLNPLVPDLIRFHFTNQKEKLIDLITTNWFVGALLINFPIMLITPMIKSLFFWWTNGSVPFDSGLFYTLSFSVALLNHGKIFVLFFTCINQLQVITAITTSRFLVLIIVGTAFLTKWGLHSIGWAFLVSEILASICLPFFFFFRKGQFQVFNISKVITFSLPTLLLGFFFIAAFYFESDIWYLLTASVIINIGLSFLLWHCLSSSVKDRLLMNKIKIPWFTK
ncbi:MAG: hypothetical protein ACK5UP_07830 [Bacteroidota bacterium]|jgi:O-antigen/teichoic acid export membrane protein|nr:hypothetical protein [Cytophagales bacterium]